MNASNERSRALWMDSASVQEGERLTGDQNCDVVVVGAGIAGLSTAYELAQRRRSVVVVDRGALGGGMTARTTAHLASELDDFYHELINVRGLDEATLYFQSQAAAVDRIESIQAAERIACDFRRLDGYLIPANEEGLNVLEREVEACRQVGFHGVGWVERGSDGGRRPPWLRFPDQGRFHPLKYLDGLVRCIRRDGGRLFSDAAVVKVEEASGEVRVTTEAGHVVRAGAAVVATNSPINDHLAIHTKQAPYRTYVIAGRVPRGAVGDALYWDTYDPYHYVRLQEADDRTDWLIVGGEDHKTAHDFDYDERFASLAEWTHRHYPSFGEVEYRWSGQVYEPSDYAAFAGRNPGNENVYVVTGDSGQGMTNGVAASLILRDLVTGTENAWAKAYAPNRKSLKTAGDYISENLSVASNLTEYVRGGEISSVDELRPGEGAVMRRGAAKLAAYKDESGAVHLRSAVCTHAGCIVHWNGFERCWDCPCHGSQFAPTGEVLQGPAFKPLAAAE